MMMNDERRREIKRKYKLSYKGKLSEKRYRDKNRKKIQERMTPYMKKYILINREAINATRRKYCKQRYYDDENFRLSINLKTRILNALNSQNSKKTNHTVFLLGANIIFVKNHIESQFKDGMSWENYGEWEIDHILPCSKFDLTIPLHQRICFNYRNLQPLWAKDNLLKRNYDLKINNIEDFELYHNIKKSIDDSGLDD